MTFSGSNPALEEIRRENLAFLQLNKPIEDFIKAVGDAHLLTKGTASIGENLEAGHHKPNITNREVRVTSFCEKIIEISNVNLSSWGYGCLTNYEGELYVYQQTHFVLFDKSNIYRMVKENGRIFDLSPEDYLSSKFGELCEKQLLYSAAAPTMRPNDMCLVNFQNGVYEFQSDGNSRKLLLEKPTYFFRYSLPFSYNPAAQCPKFDAFLKETLEEDQCIDVVYEFLGFPFCTPTEVMNISLEKMPLFYGSGANGKSVLFNVCSEMYGKDNVSYYGLHDVSTNKNTRHALGGILVNWCSDADRRVQSGPMKALISREPMSAEIKYGRTYTLTQPPAFMMNTNELPSANDNSDGWFRRLDIIKFEKTIPTEKRDPKLATKLKSELAGIFNKTMIGRCRLLYQGQTKSAKIAAANAEYETIENSAKAWIEATGMVRDDHSRIPFGDAYGDHVTWCANNSADPTKKREFNQYLGRKFSKIKSSTYCWKARYTKFREL